MLGVIRWHRLENVVLVGHSYGGLVITGVADRAHDKLATLIYFDAFLPRNGQSMVDLQSPERFAALMKRAEELGDGWKIPNRPAAAWGIEKGEDARWYDSLTTMHPVATLTQTLALAGNHLKVPNKVYVLATENEPSPFRRFAAWTRTQPDWKTVEIASHHYPMITMPEETARLLLRVSGAE